MRAIPTIFAATTIALLGTSIASAHVIVTPNQVGVAAEQTFSISVPSEENASTVSLRLAIPSGLTDVFPTVQAGWNTITKTASNGDVTEIDWTGGSIPSQDRDDFTFRAQAPANPTTLDWKAYQTYSNGTVISWDQTPVPGHADDDSMTPYSTTAVINDLASSTPVTSASTELAIALGAAGTIIGLAALAVAARRR
jgi:uncharacterized protein YcnI